MNDTILELAVVIDSLHATPEYLSVGVPMVRVVDINNNFLQLDNCFLVDQETCDRHNKNHIPQKGDVIITRVGSYGMLAYVDIDSRFCLGQNIAIISPYKAEDGKFLYYYLKSPYIQNIIYGNSGGSSYKCIGLEQIKKLPLMIEGIEYRRIGDLLYQIDCKIENNRKINEELDRAARTIYDYWFLQFDFPDESGKPYKSSGGKMVWNEELKKEIPDGWRIGTLNQYIDRDKGGDWGKEKEEGNYIRKVSCLRGADFPSITGTATLTAPKRFILEKNIDKFLENGDLIIEISGGSPTQSTGRICYINDSLLERFDIDVITSNFCKAISLKNIAYMYWFYVQWKKIYESNILFKYEGKTTGIKNLLFDIFIKDYKFVQPPDELIFKYNEKVADIFEKIQKNQKESQELASLRDFLLPLLMNGQVGFKE